MTLRDRATEAEPFPLPAGRTVEIPKIQLRFAEWTGEPVEDDYGGKPIVDHQGEALYAELAILRLLEEDGWDGRWIDTFKNRVLVDLPERGGELPLPDERRELLAEINELKGSASGAWDLFAWRGDEVLFAESKRTGRDSIRESQVDWLDAALQVGLTRDNLLMVEWSLTG